MSARFPLPEAELRGRLGEGAYPASLVLQGAAALWLERRGAAKELCVAAPAGSEVAARFVGQLEPFVDRLALKRCPTDHANAAALRRTLTNLAPRPLGLATSAGFGDRLGVATPGHARALAHAGGVAPIFAQQSIREMARTRRSPEAVMTDATWGAFEAGWRSALGADADHLKTVDDIDACAAAGFSFYTVDPGEHVDDAANDLDAARLRDKLAALPWEVLASSPEDTLRRYAGRAFDLGDRRLAPSEAEVARAALKYGAAVAQVVRLYRHLAAKDAPFELEVSVDETATPTTHAEHVYIASELKRLGVAFVSLAPRYVGRFEKGVDYLGDLGELGDDLAGHAAVARALGPYKLSLHSGSDKFSVYPIIAEVTSGQVHLKTAGTSYLEALRVVAQRAPELFRSVAELARAHFEADKASYHISAELARVPDPSQLTDAELPELLEQDDARQVLHVTFGSALERYKPEIIAVLLEHEATHYEGLARHFERHLRPFAGRRT